MERGKRSVGALKVGAMAALAILLVRCGQAGAAQGRIPQGGGVTYPAWSGEYFANANLEGAPAYMKSENRVRSDWEDWRPVLGVRAESVRDFPTDNFSARWSAKLIARFDEEYTFKLISDEGARLKIRPTGTRRWRKLIDAWQPHRRRADTAKMRLDPATEYDVQIEYYDLTGDAVCELYWSSPSTPEEVVDYASGNTVREYWPQSAANMMDFTRIKMPDAQLDEDGWPKADFKTYMSGGWPIHHGRMLFCFKGLAEVHVNGTFLVGEETYENVLPKGAGYEPSTNETRALIETKDRGDGNYKSPLEMRQTQRSPDAPVGSGVRDIYWMAPKRIGGKEPHEPGEIINGEARDAFLPAYAFRVQKTGLNNVARWEDRTFPTYCNIHDQTVHNDMAYEKLVLAANEMGRDLYMCYSDSIDRDYMVKMAKVTRFGSDGKEPYNDPTEDPVWPPLNPNLRLYLEHGNEMGWSAIQPRQWARRYDREIFRNEDNPIWRVLNFDGRAEDNHHGGLMRYHAYRTVMMSDAMREVWGDAAINDKVRVMIFGQYQRHFQNTLCQFIDDYYNNGAGQFVANPRPVNEILFGAGPALYYGTGNMWAVGDDPVLKDASFEGYPLRPGAAAGAPARGPWRFESTAGVVDDRLPRHQAFQPVPAEEKPYKLNSAASVGIGFTVGPTDLYAYETGRIVQGGEKGAHPVSIFTAEAKKLHGMRASREKLDKMQRGQIAWWPLQYDAWITPGSSRVGVWKLEAGKSYICVSREPANAELPSPNTPLRAGPGLLIQGGVVLADGEVKRVSRPGTGFPLATFRYTGRPATPGRGIALVPSDPKVDPTWMEGGRGRSNVPEWHRAGTRAAFIAGRGRISQRFTVDRPGDYMFVFTANNSIEKAQPITITFDGKTAWEKSPVGGSRKHREAVFQWGTRYMPLEAGEHELVIEGTADDPAAVLYIYASHIGSVRDYAGGEDAGNFLDAGGATGQTDARFARNVRVCTLMAQNWGLVPMSYEGGTNAGGDWNGGGVLYTQQFKWNHPISKVADNNWAHFWHSYGGRNAMYYYPGFPGLFLYKAETYMPWAAAIERAGGWVLEPSKGIPLPATLTVQIDHSQGSIASGWKGWTHPLNMQEQTSRLEQGQWKSWIVRAPEARRYRFTLSASAGGAARLSVDDSQGIVKGPSDRRLTTELFLTKGMHAVKVRCDEGAFDLSGIAVQ